MYSMCAAYVGMEHGFTRSQRALHMASSTREDRAQPWHDGMNERMVVHLSVLHAWAQHTPDVDESAAVLV